MGSGSAIAGPVRSIINCDSIRRISGVFISPSTTAVEQKLLVLNAQVVLHHVEIADQPLALFGHEVAIPGRIPVDQQRVAVERLYFQEPADQAGRPAKIPVQGLAPGLCLFFQQLIQVATAQMAQFHHACQWGIRQSRHTVQAYTQNRR